MMKTEILSFTYGDKYPLGEGVDICTVSFGNSFSICEVQLAVEDDEDHVAAIDDVVFLPNWETLISVMVSSFLEIPAIRSMQIPNLSKELQLLTWIVRVGRRVRPVQHENKENVELALSLDETIERNFFEYAELFGYVDLPSNVRLVYEKEKGFGFKTSDSDLPARFTTESFVKTLLALLSDPRTAKTELTSFLYLPELSLIWSTWGDAKVFSYEPEEDKSDTQVALNALYKRADEMLDALPQRGLLKDVLERIDRITYGELVRAGLS